MAKQNCPAWRASDSLALALWPLAAALAAWLADLNFLVTTLLFFGGPALYLSLKDKSKIRRNLIFSAVLTVAGLYTDYIAERDHAWFEPQSIFSFRLGGLEPVESVLWFFLLTYLIVAFYEHFFDHSRHKLMGRRMRLMFVIVAVASILFWPLLLARPAWLDFSFFYLKFGLGLGLLPLLAFLVKFPRFLTIFLKTAPYFLALSLLNEFVGLHNGHWLFPGPHFIGWVGLGSFHFPVEELVFWMVLFSSIVIMYFEFFDDNRLNFRRARR